MKRAVHHVRRFWDPSIDFLKYCIVSHNTLFRFTVWTFLASILLGAFAPDVLKTTLLGLMQQKVAEWHGSATNLFVFIFLNNLRAIGLIFGSGIIFFLPLMILFLNGYLIGGILTKLASDAPNGITSIFGLLIALLPHGIFELPTLVLASFLAALFGLKIFAPKKIAPKYTRRSFIVQMIRLVIFIIIPLIVVAAFVEATISSVLSEKLLGGGL